MSFGVTPESKGLEIEIYKGMFLESGFWRPIHCSKGIPQMILVSTGLVKCLTPKHERYGFEKEADIALPGGLWSDHDFMGCGHPKP